MEGKEPKAVSLLTQGSAGLDKVRQRARDLGIAFSQEAGENAEKFNDSLDDLTKSINRRNGQPWVKSLSMQPSPLMSLET